MPLVISTKRKRDIDENILAEYVSVFEGKKESINIAQIKETQKILLDLLGMHWQSNPRGVVALLRKHGG